MKVLKFGLSLFLLAGCSTAVKVADVNQAENATEGAVFSLHFVDEDEILASGKCQIELREINTSKNYSFDYHVEQKSLVLSLPTGTYNLNNLYCGNKGSANLSSQKIISPFTVFPGKLTVVPPFALVLTRYEYYYSVTSDTVGRGITDLDFDLSSKQKNLLVKPKTGEAFSFAEGLKPDEI